MKFEHTYLTYRIQQISFHHSLLLKFHELKVFLDWLIRLGAPLPLVHTFQLTSQSATCISIWPNYLELLRLQFTIWLMWMKLELNWNTTIKIWKVANNYLCGQWCLQSWLDDQFIISNYQWHSIQYELASNLGGKGNKICHFYCFSERIIDQLDHDHPGW